MANKLFIIFLVAALAGMSFAGIAQVTFQKMYGGNTALNSGTCHQQTVDGGYILAGHTIAFGAGNFDFWLIKVESDGDIEWSKTFGGFYSDGVQYIQQTSDSGFIILGTTQSFGSNQMLLIKTDQFGNVAWSRTYGGAAADIPHIVNQTIDGGYIFAGNTVSFGQGNHDLFLIKTNSSGDIIWQQTYGGANDDQLTSLVLTADGGYAISGYTFSFGSGYYDYYLVRTDSMGTLLWSKTFGSIKYEYCYSSIQTSDQGFVLCGYINDNGFGDRVILLIKTDSAGDTLWTKTYLGPADLEAYAIDETSNNGLIITGEIRIPSTGGQNIILLSTDSIGDFHWAKSYGVNFSNYSYSVKHTTDGGYTLLGRTYLTGGMDERMFFIKTDSLGNSGCYDSISVFSQLPFQISIQQPPTQSTPSLFQSNIVNVDTSSGVIYYTNCSSVGINDDFHERNESIYPNPGSNIINLEFKDYFLPGEITMFNYSGVRVLSEVINDNIVRLDISKLPAGIYITEIYDGFDVIYRKIVKLN